MGFRCGEDTGAMLDHDGNKFCQQCQKTVIDFTQWPEEEIIRYFEQNRGNTCGMFGKSQLDRLNSQLQPSPSPAKHRLVASFLGGALALGPLAKAQVNIAKDEVAISQRQSEGHFIDKTKVEVGFPEFSSGFVIAKKNVNPTPSSTLFFSGTILADKNELQEGISIHVFSQKGYLGETFSDEQGKFQLSLAQGPNLEDLTMRISQDGFDELVIPGIQIGNHDIRVFMARRNILSGPELAVAYSSEKVEKERDSEADSSYISGGIILDKDSGEPLHGVVILLRLIDSTLASSFSNEEGRYQLSLNTREHDLEQLKLEFSYLGYESLCISGTDAINSHNEVHLTMGEIILTGEVVVYYPLHRRILRAPRRLWWGIRNLLSR